MMAGCYSSSFQQEGKEMFFGGGGVIIPRHIHQPTSFCVN